jgi:predicted nucleic acid-binding protein
MRVLVDTNVVLDYFLKRGEFFEPARTLFEEMGDDMEYVVAVSALTDIYYIVRKAVGRARAESVIQRCLIVFEVVDTLKIDAEGALASKVQDFEDAVLEQVAKREKVKYIITRDEKDFVGAKVKVVTPREMIMVRGRG